MFKLIILILALGHCTIHSWSQTNAKNELIASSIAEIPKIFGKTCDDNCSTLLKEKIELADMFLSTELKQMVLVDSSSFYEIKAKELKNIEDLQKIHGDESAGLKKKLEETYLLLSILKPRLSDGLMIKLFAIYLDEDPLAVNTNDLASVLNYKVWLYDLLDDRFHNETNVFSNSKSNLFYNKMVLNLYQPFISIDSEEKLLIKLTDWVTLAKAANNQYRFEELMAQVYQNRIEQVEKVRKGDHSNELFYFTEELYERALIIVPDDSTLNYNFGIFYYNELVYLYNQEDTGLGRKALKEKEERIEQLLVKSEALLKTK
ncbi:hypothetical protein [Crocinitomix catalasitica]|uniref:hypothetical protein n=1 Tax=Crocinitomix catalasitica TaxID=184607 RepID=UPI0004809032|nr:hypothetical protein [Crocinitomix catalasitica]